MGIIENIEQKLTEKFTNSDLFANVYDFYVIENDGFPYVAFELSDFEWEKTDTCENKRIWTFKIVIFQELTNMTRREAKKSLYNITEKVIDMFDKDQFLWWLVDNTEVVAWNMWQYSKEKGWKMLFIEIDLSFETTLQIN